MSNISLEARKLSIIEYLADLQDEGVLQQIENIIKPKIDFWDELNEHEKDNIKKGIEQLDNGQRTEFKQFIQQFRKNK
jgi:hypothetical protein